MANWENCQHVERVTGIANCVWVFKGTQVPLYALYETLASGATVNDFAGRFGVDIERVEATLLYEAEELHDYRLEHSGAVPYARNPNADRTSPDDAIWKTCPLVEQNPGILGGVWIFKRSRFPLYTVHDNLASGATLDEFDEWYQIEKDRVVAVLQYQAQALREVHTARADTV